MGKGEVLVLGGSGGREAGKGREGKGREGKGREGKGREGKGGKEGRECFLVVASKK